MNNFELQRPTNLADAVSALANEDAQALGGGQTLIPTMKQRLAAPEVLVSLSGVAEITGICRGDDGAICIGGATSHATVASELAESFPALSDLAGRIGDPAVRSRGTIGGSLANNDPAACYPAAALACAATICTNTRQIPAEAFFQGLFETALEDGEIITEVRFPVPTQANYQKFLQPASRFALVGVFIARYNSVTQVAVTGASEDGVYRWSEAEEALSSNFSPAVVSEVSVPAVGMISDMHGSAEYRAHLVKVLTGRAVASAT